MFVKVGANISDFENKMKTVQSKMGEVGDKLGSAGKVMTKRVTAPIVGLGTAAVVTGMRFDEQMSKVQAISGAAGDDLERLREKAKEMGATTVFSAAESSEALQFMALAGWDTDQMLAGIQGTLDLAAAGALDLGRASDIVTDTMSQFGMKAEDAGRASDVFAKAQAIANTNVEQLGEAMVYGGATAAAAGMDIEQTSAILGVFADNGFKGSQAGTILDGMFRDLRNSAEDGAVAVGDTSIALYDAEGNMRSMADIMADVEGATEGMSDKQRDAALGSIFQARSIRGVNTILGEGTDKIYEYEEALYGSSGAAGDMADTMTDNLGGAFKELMSALEGLAIEFSDILAPAIRDIAEWLTEMTRKFSESDESTKRLVVAISAIAAAIGPVLWAGSVLIGIFGKIITVVTTVWGWITKLRTVFMALRVALGVVTGPVGWIILALTALTAIGVAVWKNWDTIKEKAVEIWGAISDWIMGVAGPLVDWLREKFELAKEVIAQIWDGVAQYFTGIWEVIKNVILGALLLLLDLFTGDFETMREHAAEIMENIRGGLEQAWEGIKTIFEAALKWIVGLVGGDFEEAKATIERIWEAVESILGDVWEFIKNTFKNALDFVKALVSGDFDGMRKAIANQMENIRENLGSAWDKAKTIFREAGARILEIARGKFEDAKQAVKDKMDETRDGIKDAWDNAVDFLTSIDLREIGKDVIRGFINGIGSMASSLWSKAQEMANNAKNAIANALGVASPAKELIEIGVYTGEGFALGMDRTISDIVGKAKAMAQAAMPDVNRVGPYQTPLLGSAETETTINVYTDGIFNGARFEVRSDNDIDDLAAKISRKIAQNTKGVARGRGHVVRW